MKSKTLVIISPYTTRSGYGEHSRKIIKSILNAPEISDEYDIKLISTKWGNTPIDVLDKEDEHLYSYRIPNLNFQPDVSIQISIPSEFQRIGKFSIGITAGTEVNIAPLNFVQGCQNVDLILTPSQFTKDVLIGTKYDKKNQQGQIEHTLEVNKPVEVLFEGLDVEKFNKTNIDKESNIWKMLNEDVKEDFCFLVVGHWLNAVLGQDRKDIGMTLKVFFDTFKDKKKRPGLILKTSGAGFSVTERDQIIDKINQVQELIREEGFKGQFPNVYLINGDLTDNEMNSLYNHPKVKSLVSFSKGEGYGLPIQEFTMTGKPVISSAYSGPMDFLNKDFAFLLPGQLTQIHPSAANDWLPKEGQWFTVNYNFASMLMKDMFENYEKYLEKSRKHIQYTKNNFSLTTMQEKFLEIWKKYVNFVNNEIKINLPKLKKI